MTNKPLRKKLTATRPLSIYIHIHSCSEIDENTCRCAKQVTLQSTLFIGAEIPFTQHCMSKKDRLTLLCCIQTSIAAC